MSVTDTNDDGEIVLTSEVSDAELGTMTMDDLEDKRDEWNEVASDCPWGGELREMAQQRANAFKGEMMRRIDVDRDPMIAELTALDGVGDGIANDIVPRKARCWMDCVEFGRSWTVKRSRPNGIDWDAWSRARNLVTERAAEERANDPEWEPVEVDPDEVFEAIRDGRTCRTTDGEFKERYDVEYEDIEASVYDFTKFDKEGFKLPDWARQACDAEEYVIEQVRRAYVAKRIARYMDDGRKIVTPDGDA